MSGFWRNLRLMKGKSFYWDTHGTLWKDKKERKASFARMGRVHVYAIMFFLEWSHDLSPSACALPQTPLLSVRYICSSGLWELCNLPVKHHIQFWSYTALPHVDMKGKKGKKGKKAEHGVKKVENDYVWIKLFSLELGCGFVHFWMQSRRPINLHCRCAFSLFWISWSYSLSISLQCFNNCSQYWSHFSHILHLFY